MNAGFAFTMDDVHLLVKFHPPKDFHFPEHRFGKLTKEGSARSVLSGNSNTIIQHDVITSEFLVCRTNRNLLPTPLYCICISRCLALELV